MNVQDVVDRVRRTFGDEAAVQVSDDDILRWINDGQIEIVKANEQALQKSDFVDLVAGQATYTLPTDLLLLRSLRFKMSDMQSYVNLRYKNMQEFDLVLDGWDGTTYTNSKPLYFTMFEGQVILFPTPDTAATDGLKVLYNQKPTEVTTLSDEIHLPLIYHNSIFKYCMWQASHLDDDHEPAMMYRTDFQSDIDLLNTRETKDPVATYPTITVRAEDM